MLDEGLEQWFSTGNDSPTLAYVWQYLETLFVITTGFGDATGIENRGQGYC